MTQKGFTLIELLIVMAIAGILGTLSIASFSNYTKVQTLQTSANDVAAMLNLAKSRAQSQVKPSSCPTDNAIPANNFNLYGYRVVITALNKYTLYATCSNTVINPVTDTTKDKIINQQDKQLPSGVTFSVNASFFFTVLTGAASGGSVNIMETGVASKTITVSPLGGITITP
jgi:prepilin-type N-terminal cleavage/methylation domain-containing protein